ncbi:MAG: Rieske 2Fe-2S domain-containing protein [Gammaproteobacteria bacterium]|nr:Rieske 2Fe-2S domain-containing protein [Gammaproteobacteria bacterium]
MLIKDQWYPVCAASRLQREGPWPFRVWDRELVAFRDAGGAPRVLLDRCCHRGAQLSLGAVRDGCLACPYHGWEYDGAGRVVKVPSLGPDRSLPAYAVPGFPAVEADHYVWVWIPGERARPDAVPRLHGIEHGVWTQRSAVWRVGAMAAAENQLDSAHLAFVHGAVHPTKAGEGLPLREGRFAARVGPESVVTTWAVPPETPDDRFPGPERPGLSFLSFELPYRNYVFLEDEGTRAIFNWVPLSENECRLEVIAASPPGGPGAPLEVRFAEDEPPVLAQDRRVLESLRAAPEGAESAERHVLADQGTRAARGLVADALNGPRRGPSRRLRWRCFV